MTRALKRLRQDRAGSTIIEFAFLAPVIITMFLAILQVGTWMHSYNALRSIAADAGRYTAVQYQKGNKINNITISTWAHDRAISNYLFKDENVSADVTDAATQNIVGVTEKTLTMTVTYETFLQIIGGTNQTFTFKRPIFVKSS